LKWGARARAVAFERKLVFFYVLLRRLGSSFVKLGSRLGLGIRGALGSRELFCFFCPAFFEMESTLARLHLNGNFFFFVMFCYGGSGILL
jgi:hypothetical protein